MREHGGEAFARPGTETPSGQGYVVDQTGMSYRDWMVGGMMREFFIRNVTDADKLAEALVGDQQIRDAVLFAHRVADAIIEERYK